MGGKVFTKVVRKDIEFMFAFTLASFVSGLVFKFLPDYSFFARLPYYAILYVSTFISFLAYTLLTRNRPTKIYLILSLIFSSSLVLIDIFLFNVV